MFTIPVSQNTEFKVRWRFASNASNNSYGWVLDEVAGEAIRGGAGETEKRRLDAGGGKL